MARGIPDDQLTPNGTLKPIYERDIPNEQGDSEFAVGMEAFRAICEGMACGVCLEYRAFRGSYLPRCPTCGEPTGSAAPEQITSEWWLELPTIRP